MLDILLVGMLTLLVLYRPLEKALNARRKALVRAFCRSHDSKAS